MPPTYNIIIELEIHVITCPGVWLCQNDNVELSITTLGYKFKGIPMPPRFPLCYHETFVMDGYFSDVANVSDLEKALDEEEITFTLWQSGRRLAYYSNKLGVILNYAGCLNNSFARTDNAIIMTRGSCYPGTISPKIEYTASIQYNRRCVGCNRIENDGRRFLKNLYEPGVLNENFSQLRHTPVCHAKLKRKWRYLGDVSRRSCITEESILCDYCLNTIPKDNGNHALSADNNNDYNFIPNEEDNDYVKTLNEKTNFDCGHVKWSQDGVDEANHTENRCSICLKYRSLFNITNEINDPKES